MAFRSIGLEISTSAVRAVELLIGGQFPSLVNYHEVQLPPKAVQEGEIFDFSVVRDRLKQLWDEGDFSQNRVNVGVAGLRAIIRELTVPSVSDAELKSSVALNAIEVIPFPAESTILDYKVIGEKESTSGSEKKILVAAAHRELVEPLVRVLDQVGLVPLSIDLSALALVRAMLVCTEPLAVDGAEAIVSIGAGLTMVVVEENGIATFVRTIGQGGDNVTEAIASVLDSPFQDAEALKWNLDLPSQQQQAALAAARDASTSLINEIRSSIEYYNAIPDRKDVQRVVVTGGGSLLEGLLPRLQQAFRVPVIPLDLLKGLDISQIDASPEDLARRVPFIATVTGLALPEPPGVKPINLVPPEVKQKVQNARIRNIAMTVAVAIVAIYCALGVWKFFNLRSAENASATNQATIASLNSQITSYNKGIQLKNELLSYSQAIVPQLEDDVYWPQVNAQAIKDIQSIGGVINPVQTGYQSPPAPLAIYSVTSASTPPTTGAPQSQVIATITMQVQGPASSGYSFYQDFVNAFTNDANFSDPHGTQITQVGPNTTGHVRNPISFTATVNVTGLALSPRISYYKVS